MHFLKFYQFLIGNKASFLQHYTGEGQEELYSQASLFWDKLDSLSIVFILLFTVFPFFCLMNESVAG